MGLVAYDSSGFQRHGFLQGTANSFWTSTARQGSFGISLDATLRTSVDLPFLGLYAAETRALWFQTTSSLSVMSLMSYSRDDSQSAVTFELRLVDTRPQVFVFDGLSVQTVQTDTGSITIRDGAWHHIAMTRSAAGVTKVYLDGVVVGTSTIDVNVLRQQGRLDSLCLGRRRVGSLSGLYFSGLMDDVRLYSKELSGEDIALLGELVVYVQAIYVVAHPL